MTQKNILYGLMLLLVCLFVAPPLSHADETINWGSTENDNLIYARSGDVLYGAQYFTPSGNAGSAAVTLKQARGSTFPDGVAMTLTIEGDNAGAPDGVALGSTSVLSTGLNVTSGNCNGQTVLYPTISGLSLVSGTKYWVVVGRTMTAHSYPNAPLVCASTDTPHYSYFDSSWNVSSTWEFQGSISLYSSTSTPAGGSVATSSVDQTQQNVWNGYWVFFAMLVFVVWLGRSTKT